MPDLSTSLLGSVLDVHTVLICALNSLIIGIAIACVHMIDNRYNKGFVVTLALLPTIVQLVIMLVNGNLGAGVAVAGAFNLIRFRSMPGTARDIGSIFWAMAIGLATGMGYVFFAWVFFVIVAAVQCLLIKTPFGKENEDQRILKITIPENLDYENLFDDPFAAYTNQAELERVKTTNLGSLFELSYRIQLKDSSESKKFIDELRCRNGNLNISLGRPSSSKEEL